MRAPDLQQLVEKAGRRLAAQLGESYDPMRHAGWPEITAREWAAFDREVEVWREWHRTRHVQDGVP
jgi:hypothetical protein